MNEALEQKRGFESDIVFQMYVSFACCPKIVGGRHKRAAPLFQSTIQRRSRDSAGVWSWPKCDHFRWFFVGTEKGGDSHSNCNYSQKGFKCRILYGAQ